ncbi:mitotic spindle assembly checkpoint protein MAD2B-like [Tubulanus polymorphus]|uniref:mitotic spindle assembly checkpoint protein MAD2B-like n=1 Tax=Tubulanus polymorphus TaxID=672921 RepID=UPI003DA31721
MYSTAGSASSSDIQQDVTQVAVDILSEFLEVAFHCILYVREVYPSGVFERRKKYNVPVQMCCHPDVNKYIQDTITGLKLILDRQSLEKICLIILSPDHKPLEKFTFEIGTKQNPSLSEDKFLLKLEQSLRAFLLKLNICDATLESLPEECSWAVQVHTKDSTFLEIEERQIEKDFPWIEADESQTIIEDANVVPLKALNSSLIKMQLYVEESGTKETL